MNQSKTAVYWSFPLKKTNCPYIATYSRLLHNFTISIMQDTAYNLHHISSDEQLLYEEYWSAGEEKDSEDEVTI